MNPENVRAVTRAYSSHAVAGDFMPTIYVVEPTNLCNLRCTICARNIASPPRGTMLPATSAGVAAAIAPYAEVVMLYFMGEPTLATNFAQTLRLFSEKTRAKLVVSTNGVALDEANMRALVQYCDLIICPIDRWDEHAFESIRQGASFTEVVRNVRSLLRIVGSRKKPTIVVKALNLGMSEMEAQAFRDEWSSLGAFPLVGWVDTWAGRMEHLAALSDAHPPYQAHDRVACADLWFKMVINFEGQAVLCCHDFNYSIRLGTIRDVTSLGAAWHGDLLTHYRSRHVAGDFTHVTPCKTCHEWGELEELQAYLQLSPDLMHLVF